MAEGDLTAPLLAEEVVVDIETSVVDIETSVDGGESSNPFAFLGTEEPPSLPACTIDPFRNDTVAIYGVYEWVKIAVCLPLAAVRLAIFGLALIVGFLSTKMALGGWKDREKPMPRWRCGLMWITRICSRCILFSFGYHWIHRIGKPAPREIAPIVVSNHVSYIDPIFYFYEMFPTMVSSESHDSIPFVGTIIRAMQVIYVDRFSATSRKDAVYEIRRKVSCNGFPRVLLFPEGTTTNGRALISFKVGAFIPGHPVQPVVIRYPHVHFDQSWGNISLTKLMFRMFTQFHNFMEVKYLPVIFPPVSKLENASRFAEETSYAMASALNVMRTSHSFGDVMLFTRALQVGKENPSLYMVEMASFSMSFDIGTMEAVGFLDTFLAMNPDSSGRVKDLEFSACPALGTNPLFKKIFHFLDVEKKGSITFQQFLVGSAHVMAQPSFQQTCEDKFNALSDNGSGRISKKKFADFMQSAIPGTSFETASELLSLLDTDNDGVVNRTDFMTFMRRNPLLTALFASSQNPSLQTRGGHAKIGE